MSETTNNIPAPPDPKKGLLAIGIIAAAIGLIFLIQWALPRHTPIGSSGLYIEKEVQQQVTSVVELFNVDDYTYLQAISAKDLKSSMSELSLTKKKARISSDWGGFQGFGNITLSETKQYGKILATGEVQAVYKNITVTFTISLTEDLKIAEFSMR